MLRLQIGPANTHILHKFINVFFIVLHQKMDIYTILGAIVLLTLAIAIARQLSENTGIYLLPDSFGTAYSEHGWDRGV